MRLVHLYITACLTGKREKEGTNPAEIADKCIIEFRSEFRQILAMTYVAGRSIRIGVKRLKSGGSRAYERQRK